MAGLRQWQQGVHPMVSICMLVAGVALGHARAQSPSMTQTQHNPAARTQTSGAVSQQHQQPSHQQGASQQHSPQPSFQQQRHQHPRPDRSVLGPPPVEFKPELLDLGTLRPNDRITAAAQMLNVSDKWLKVLAIKPDCSCTSAEISETVLAPGQAATIHAEYHANKSMGESKSAVRVLIEGYDIIDLPIKAFIALAVRAEPAFIHALPDDQGTVPLMGELTIKSQDDKPFRILAVNGEPAELIDFDPAKDEPRNQYRLRWDLTAYNPQTCRDAEGNKMPAWVAIETDHPDCPIFDVEVRNNCNRRDLRREHTWLIQDRRVMLGRLEAGKPVEFEVVVRWFPNRSQTDVVSTALAESRDFSAELVNVQPMDDGLLCRVRLTPAEHHRGLLMGNVRLHANRQSGAVLVIGTVR